MKSGLTSIVAYLAATKPRWLMPDIKAEGAMTGLLVRRACSRKMLLDAENNRPLHGLPFAHHAWLQLEVIATTSALSV